MLLGEKLHSDKTNEFLARPGTGDDAVAQEVSTWVGFGMGVMLGRVGCRTRHERGGKEIKEKHVADSRDSVADKGT